MARFFHAVDAVGKFVVGAGAPATLRGRQALNPLHCLKDPFTRLPSAKITEIKRFTPSEWAKVKAAPIEDDALYL